MDEKKRLKKLVLKKEEIVNLNDYQMGEMKGGISAGCAAASVVSAVVSASIAVYTLGKEESWWRCGYSKQENCMTDISNKLVNLPDGSRSCELPDVNIYGYRP